MNGEDLVKFLRLMRDVGCVDPYWKTRIDNTILAMGGTLKSQKFNSPPVEHPGDSDAEVA